MIETRRDQFSVGPSLNTHLCVNGNEIHEKTWHMIDSHHSS
jgi:hypothetical protein